MKKKLFALMLVIVMLVSSVPVHAGQVTPTFEVEAVEAAAGAEVDITISLKNNPGITSIKLFISYHEDLTLTNVQYNVVTDQGMGQGMKPAKPYQNPVILNWFEGIENVYGDWVFATLTFKVADSAQPGEKPVTVTYNPDDIFSVDEDFNETNVHFDIQSGGVTIACEHSSKTEVPAKAADCMNPGNYQYFVCDACYAAFKADGTKTTAEDEAIAALGHDMGDANCTEPRACTRCDYTEGAALGHDLLEANCTEPIRCTRCDYTEGVALGHSFTEKVEDAAHLVAGTGDNCQNPRKYFFDCANCDSVGTETWEAEAGSHIMASGWTSENGKHFHKCTVAGCDYVEDEADCFGGTASCTNQAICSVCQNPYGELSEHEYNSQWSQGDENGHWHDCVNCSAHTAAEPHVPNVEEATEDTAKFCVICNYVIEPQKDHIHITTKVEGKDATCTEDGQKTYYTCNCGQWFADSDASEVITDKSSVVITKLGHSWMDATCDAPKTCERCGAVEGEKLNHSWMDATCDTPMTCERCQMTEGEALGHKPGSELQADSDKHWSVCEVCNEKMNEVEHADTDEDLKCDECGTDLPAKDNPPLGDSSKILTFVIVMTASIFVLAALLLYNKKDRFSKV